jgi:hypothetical protein
LASFPCHLLYGLPFVIAFGKFYSVSGLQLCTRQFQINVDVVCIIAALKLGKIYQKQLQIEDHKGDDKENLPTTVTELELLQKFYSLFHCISDQVRFRFVREVFIVESYRQKTKD